MNRKTIALAVGLVLGAVGYHIKKKHEIQAASQQAFRDGIDAARQLVQRERDITAAMQSNMNYDYVDCKTGELPSHYSANYGRHPKTINLSDVYVELDCKAVNSSWEGLAGIEECISNITIEPKLNGRWQYHIPTCEELNKSRATYHENFLAHRKEMEKDRKQKR